MDRLFDVAGIFLPRAHPSVNHEDLGLDLHQIRAEESKLGAAPPFVKIIEGFDDKTGLILGSSRLDVFYDFLGRSTLFGKFRPTDSKQGNASRKRKGIDHKNLSFEFFFMRYACCIAAGRRDLRRK